MPSQDRSDILEFLGQSPVGLTSPPICVDTHTTGAPAQDNCTVAGPLIAKNAE